VYVTEDSHERTLLRLIDTPGLAVGDDPVAEKERERGILGLTRLVEEQFAQVMREESRIVRRATRGEDDLVHLSEDAVGGSR
jgi:septin family protein